MNSFSKIIKFLTKVNLYPKINIVEGASSMPKLRMGGKDLLTFCSNNYLGIAKNEEVEKVVVENLKKYGVGSAGTRLLSGTTDIQVEFENELAEFMGFEESITFSSGYLANAGVIRMLIDPFPYKIKVPVLNKKSIILSDELNHASIIDAIRLAKSEKVIYKHDDMDSLESNLKKYKSYKKLIVTDGIFSMDGDLAQLKRISQLAKKYDAITYVDDAHGVGVLGPNGEGTAHHLGVEKDIDVIMGSFTKAYGSIGGFTVSDKGTADYLRITARSYIFSDPIIPSVVAGLIKSLEIIKNGKDLREKTLSNGKYLRSNLRKLGFEVLGEITPIVPVILGSDKNAMEFSRQLEQAGIFAPAVRRPAVPVGRERLRLTTMATHSQENLDYLLEQTEIIGKKLRIIKK